MQSVHVAPPSLPESHLPAGAVENYEVREVTDRRRDRGTGEKVILVASTNIPLANFAIALFLLVVLRTHEPVDVGLIHRKHLGYVVLLKIDIKSFPLSEREIERVGKVSEGRNVHKKERHDLFSRFPVKPRSQVGGLGMKPPSKETEPFLRPFRGMRHAAR